MGRCLRIQVSCYQARLETLRLASLYIKQGQVIAAPTDTIYGLLADASRETALRSLFRIKTRPETKPVPLFIDSLDRLDGIVEGYPPGFDKLVRAFWPGPLTIVLPACRGVPDIVTAGTGTVAVRLPHSPLVRSLVRLSRQALTGTSANRSGWPGALSSDQVVAQLGHRVPLVLDAGRVAHTSPSTIVDLTLEKVRILREGRISSAQIQRVLAGNYRFTCSLSSVRRK